MRVCFDERKKKKERREKGAGRSDARRDRGVGKQRRERLQFCLSQGKCLIILNVNTPHPSFFIQFSWERPFGIQFLKLRPKWDLKLLESKNKPVFLTRFVRVLDRLIRLSANQYAWSS